MSKIKTVNLSKIFEIGNERIKAVDHLSLDIEQGDFMSIVGHSGSGKTTLISILGGLLRPTTGEVLIDGIDICSLGDDRLSEYRNRKIGFMFQFASLLPVLTAKENVLLPGIFSPEKNSNREKKALDYLEVLGIPEKADAMPGQLSGGQQRRVAIARSLMNDPEVILADEPTGDLDEETEVEIIEFFRRLNAEKGITFVIVTHNSDVAKSCKTQYRMSHGVLSGVS